MMFIKGNLFSLLVVVFLCHGDSYSELVRSSRTVKLVANKMVDQETRPYASAVCYGVLGCFNNSGPFNDILHRPLQPLPDSPSEIGTRFHMFTRDHRDVALRLFSWDSTNLHSSDFDAAKKTKIIVHGFLNNEKSPWVKSMVDKLLDVGDFNVIVVDWLLGAVNLYRQAAVNTRVVGAEIWYLVKRLAELKGLKNEDVHITGHSLGAHVAGYAGERIPGLARISGIDPAQPYFENTHPRVRLDPSDAAFVDVIHSDIRSFITAVGTGGYGIAQPCGHVDFYPNGGRDQPECSTIDTVKAGISVGILAWLRMFIACNHMRALYLYIESIVPSDCSFSACPCSDYETFLAGHCSSCGTRVASMGYYADQIHIGDVAQGHNKFYLKTAGFPKYCRENYFLQMRTARHMASAKGQIFVDIRKGDDSTGFIELTDGAVKIEDAHSFLFLSKVTVSEPASLRLKWKPTHSWLGMGILGNTGKEVLELASLTIHGAKVKATANVRPIAPKSFITTSLQFVDDE